MSLDPSLCIKRPLALVALAGLIRVCIWHFSDLPTPLTNVGYQGKKRKLL